MRLAALLASAALCSASLAYAQSSSQVELDDSFANLSLHVDDAVDVGGTAIAGGNMYTAVAEGQNAVIEGTQHSSGASTANADATVWNADGSVVVSSIAVNNGATVSTLGGDLRISGAQTSRGDASASTHVQSGTASAAASSSAASGNVAALSAENGGLNAALSQTSSSSVSATTEADHCCVSTDVVADAIASANNITEAGTTTTLITEARQRSTGESVAAHVDLYAGYAGNAVGNATANGNAVTVDNAWGYANVSTDQRNASNVAATSYVTLGGDFLGFASAGAYGVGNSTVVSNVGSDTVIGATQNNSGNVSADAALAGEGGDQALASSAAYGNVVTGSLCGGPCDDSNPSLTASSSQTNSGDVSSTVAVTTPRSRTVAASASAIGNATSYQVIGGN
jgi:hypothetical protein